MTRALSSTLSNAFLAVRNEIRGSLVTVSGRFFAGFFVLLSIFFAYIAFRAPSGSLDVLSMSASFGAIAGFSFMPTLVYQETRGSGLVRVFSLPTGVRTFIAQGILTALCGFGAFCLPALITFALTRDSLVEALATAGIGILVFVASMALFVPVGFILSSLAVNGVSLTIGIIATIILLRPTLTIFSETEASRVLGWFTPHLWIAEIGARLLGLDEYRPLDGAPLLAIFGVCLGFVAVAGAMGYWSWRRLRRYATVSYATNRAAQVKQKGW